MKKHAIIPIFIPHLGCPHDCVFCNQRSITARDEAPTPEAVRNTIDTWLSTLSGRGLETTEIAFYGGSFTGLSLGEQSMYLEIAAEYKRLGKVNKIHLSTRPDYIDEEILRNLKAFSVDTVELGVQSFSDEVLRLSDRGHDAETARRAALLLREYGFELGIQLMIGLPGDSRESCIYSAEECVKLRPSLARLYPTVILKDTRLYESFLSGEYLPPDRGEMLFRTKEMYKILDAAGIYIMRVGLKSTEIISDTSDATAGGSYHPAFRQLVEDAIARERIDAALGELCRYTSVSSGDMASAGETPGGETSINASSANEAQKVYITANSHCLGNIHGHKGENMRYFRSSYPQFRLSCAVDEGLRNNEYGARRA